MTLSEFLQRPAKRKLAKKSAVMEYAAASAGYEVERVSVNTILVRINGRQMPFQDMNGPASSAAAKATCLNKVATRALLAAAGLSTTRAGHFAPSEAEDAWAFATTLEGPVVVKPATEAMARGVTTGITDRAAFDAAWADAAQFYAPPQVSATMADDVLRPARIIVEEEVAGEDFRVFVVDGEVVSVTAKRRPSVQGDGQRTVGALIEAKNAVRATNPGLWDSPIPLDASLLDLLSASGRDLDSVPAAGEVVTLRSRANLWAGGDSVDLTDEAHPGFRDVAVRAAEVVPGLPYAGVDIIAPSLLEAPSSQNHVVGEVEFSPGATAHFPAVGQPRDMAGAILAFYAGLPDPARPWVWR